MEVEHIKKLLEEVKAGKLTIDEALNKLRFLPYEELGSFAHIDHHRTLRKGFPEVIFGQGKRKEDVIKIVKSMLKQKSTILITKASKELYDAVHKIDS